MLRKDLKIGARVRFIQDFPNTTYKRGEKGTVTDIRAGGYEIMCDSTKAVGGYVMVGGTDWYQFIEKITGQEIRPGQKFRVIKESPVDFYKDKARLNDVFEILGTRQLGDHIAWEMLNISNNERHGAVITALEKEFDEYLAPVGSSSARQVPAALQNWYKQVIPHLERR